MSFDCKRMYATVMSILMILNCSCSHTSNFGNSTSGSQSNELEIADKLTTLFKLSNETKYFVGKIIRRPSMRSSTFDGNEQITYKEVMSKPKEISCTIVVSKKNNKDIAMKFQTSKYNKWDYQRRTLYYGHEMEFFTLADRDNKDLKNFSTTITGSSAKTISFTRHLPGISESHNEKVEVEANSNNSFSVKFNNNQKSVAIIPYNTEVDNVKSWNCEELKQVSKDDYKKTIESVQFAMIF